MYYVPLIRNKMIKSITLLFMFTLMPSIANADSSLVVRPQVGYGYMGSSSPSNKGSVQSFGLRVLLGAGEVKKYGLEATKFQLKNGRSFSSLGIVIEQRLWGWFHMSIGTVGYFNYDTVLKNPVGLMSNLGWEPVTYKNFKPFVTYRNDLIFAEPRAVVHSLSIGFSF